MENIYLLKKCTLFKNIQDPDITYIFSKIRYKIKEFGQNEIILSEYDKAEHLGILIDGIAEIQKSLPSGKNILIKVLQKYQTFSYVFFYQKP